MEENKNLPAKPVTEKIKISKYLRNFFSWASKLDQSIKDY